MLGWRSASCWIAALLVAGLLWRSDGGAPIINAPVGMIKGIEVGSTQYFLGIPFAEPPVGDLRFAAPVAKSSLGSSVFSATTYGI